MELKAGAATHIGRVRTTNEDSFLSRIDQGLFVICDGMGGAASGEVASQLAIQTIGDRLHGAVGNGNSAGPFRARTLRLGEALQEANRAILAHARANAADAGMGTTAVGAWIADKVLSLAHVGDSRAYLWHNDRLKAVTTDHSLVEAQIRAGILNREESHRAQHQNVLLRALGREDHVEVELGEIAIGPHDCVLLCSDGLSRMVREAEIASSLARFHGDPQRACDHLVACANGGGGIDNVTVLVIAVEGEA